MPHKKPDNFGLNDCIYLVGVLLLLMAIATMATGCNHVSVKPDPMPTRGELNKE